jgi:predicted dehydrogenase
MQPIKCGIVGCGNVCDIYFQNGRKFDNYEIIACADIVKDRAKAKAREYDIPKVLPPDKLITDSDVQLVINLTIPKVHGEIALAALEAGKHVYNEKPLAFDRGQARNLLELAAQKGLRLGCAPDTFLGAGLQTCRKLIDDGWIGGPVAATAFMMHHGHEHWHPDPDFFFQPGGGPMFDMGPYYLTALCGLIGPVRRVSASARISFPHRTVTSEPKRGSTITVNTPTHVSGTLDFHSGAICTMIMSFDVWAHRLPHLEVHGTEGSISAPDPNTFGGPVLLKRGREGEWRELPLTHMNARNSRGLGVADMANAIGSGRPHRASDSLAYHVLDVMHAFQESSEAGRHVDILSVCERPAPLPLGLAEARVDP